MVGLFPGGLWGHEVVGEVFSMSAAIHYIPNDDLRRTIELRIELKKQLILLTENEIKELEESLKKADSDDHAKRVNAPPLPPII